MQTIDTKDYERLFSEKRIQSYSSTSQYDANIALIQSITPKINLLEIFIRNKVANEIGISLLIQEYSKQTQDDLLNTLLKSLNTNELNKAQEIITDYIISNKSLGFWTTIIKSRQKIILFQNPNEIDFLKYDSKISQRLAKNTNLQLRYQIANQNLGYKNIIATLLLKNIRNRAFHWENLLKTASNNSPRISVKIKINNQNTIFGISPENIEVFLEDCLKACDTQLLSISKGLQDS